MFLHQDPAGGWIHKGQDLALYLPTRIRQVYGEGQDDSRNLDCESKHVTSKVRDFQL